jgi:hypothetical protein
MNDVTRAARQPESGRDWCSVMPRHPRAQTLTPLGMMVPFGTMMMPLRM